MTRRGGEVAGDARPGPRVGPRAAARTRRSIVSSIGYPGVTGRAFGPATRYRRDLRRLAALVEDLRGGPVEIEVAVVTDAEIRRLHRDHLGVDTPTDVITFPLSPPDAPVLVGALAVSEDTARREAARRRHPPYHEWMLYVVHGALHLLGYDDRAGRERAAMRRAEARLLAALGLPHVYGPAPRRAPRAAGAPRTPRPPAARPATRRRSPRNPTEAP